MGSAERRLADAYAACDEDSRAGRWRKCGVFRKKTSEVHGTIRLVVKDALRDWGFVFLLLGIFLSGYRVLPFLKDLRAARSLPFTTIGRRVINKHVKLIAQDQANAACICILGLLQLVTVVSIPATLSDLPRCRSPRQFQRVQMRHLNHCCVYFCEIFSLFLVWRTYKLAVKSVFYSVLAPPACIAESIRPYCDGLLGVPQPDWDWSNGGFGLCGLCSWCRRCVCGGGGGNNFGAATFEEPRRATVAEPTAIGEDIESGNHHGGSARPAVAATATYAEDVAVAVGAAADAAAAADEYGGVPYFRLSGGEAEKGNNNGQSDDMQILPYGGDKNAAADADDWDALQEIVDWEAEHPGSQSAASGNTNGAFRVANGNGNAIGIGGGRNDDDSGDDEDDGESNSPTLRIRFFTSVLLWFAMLIFAISAATADERSDPGGAHFFSPCVPTTIPVVAVVGLGFLATATKRGASRLGRGDFKSPTMRVTWPNLIAVASVPLETLQLSALVLYFGWPEADLPSWLRAVAGGLSFGTLGARRAWGPAAVAFALVWALVTTLPIATREEERRARAEALALEVRRSERAGGRSSSGRPRVSNNEISDDIFDDDDDDGGGSGGEGDDDGGDDLGGTRNDGGGSAVAKVGGIGASPIFRHLTAFLGGFCFVSIVLVLQPHSYAAEGSEGDSWLESGWLEAMGAAALLFYLITTQVLSSDSALLKQRQDVGIDVR